MMQKFLSQVLNRDAWQQVPCKGASSPVLAFLQVHLLQQLMQHLQKLQTQAFPSWQASLQFSTMGSKEKNSDKKYLKII